MKTKLATIGLLAMAVAIPGVVGAAKKAASDSKPAVKAKVYTVGITGGTWAVGCAKNVRSAFAKVNGVSKTDFNCAKGLATVTMKPGATLDSKVAVAAFPKGSRYAVVSLREKDAPVVYHVGISGATWRVGCPKNVRSAFVKLPGVADAKFDFDKATATVTMKKGSVLTEETAKTAFPAAGRFQVTSFKDPSQTVPAASKVKKTDA